MCVPVCMFVLTSIVLLRSRWCVVMSVTSIEANWGHVGIRSPQGWVRSTRRVMAGLRLSWGASSGGGWRGRGRADDELGGQGEPDVADRATLQPIAEHVRAGGAHLQLRDPHGRQRGLEQARQR